MTDVGWRTNAPRVLLGHRYDDYGGSTYEYGFPGDTREKLLAGWMGHYGYPRFNRPDVGGEFMKLFYTVTHEPFDVGIIQGGSAYSEYKYQGKVMTYATSISTNPIGQLATDFGATCYSKMKPDRPIMQGLNAIYELRELPRQLQQRFLNNGLNAIGDYYLALKFGWEPLLRDLRDFVFSQRKAQEALKQLLRDEGKPVRRRINLHDTKSNVVTTTGGGGYLNYPTFVTYFYDTTGTWTQEDSFHDRVWASAQFRYWLPPGPRDVNWTRAMMAAIYGFRPSPKVVWNALPWTWLIDWYSSIGDAVSNLSTTLVDRCAADYFYVMRECYNERKYTTVQKYRKLGNNGVVTATCTNTQRSGSKSREHGNPFGYGDPGKSLSGVQLSILGALGLSRL